MIDLSELTYWHWWILAIVLVILEVFAPGAIFLWVGIAAAVVGTILLILPDISWENQILIFAVLSVVSVFASRSFLKKHPIQTDTPNLNQRGTQYIGRTFNLTEAIENGVGKIRVDDTTWKVSGEDCGIETRVKVIAADGTILKVEHIQG